MTLTAQQLLDRLTVIVHDDPQAGIFCYVGEDGIRVQAESPRLWERDGKGLMKAVPVVAIIACPMAVPTAGGPAE